MNKNIIINIYFLGNVVEKSLVVSKYIDYVPEETLLFKFLDFFCRKSCRQEVYNNYNPISNRDP